MHALSNFVAKQEDEINLKRDVYHIQAVSPGFLYFSPFVWTYSTSSLLPHLLPDFIVLEIRFAAKCHGRHAINRSCQLKRQCRCSSAGVSKATKIPFILNVLNIHIFGQCVCVKLFFFIFCPRSQCKCFMKCKKRKQTNKKRPALLTFFEWFLFSTLRHWDHHPFFLHSPLSDQKMLI